MPVTLDMTVLDNLRTLGPEGAEACDVAVKRAARKSRPVIIGTVARYYRVAEEKISKAIRIPRSADQPMAADVRIYGKRQPLYDFDAQPGQPFTGGQRPPYTSIDIKFRRVPVHMGSQQYRGANHRGEFAFIARMATGHVGLFERTGVKGRVPRKGLIRKTATGFSVAAGATAKLERIAEMFTVAIPGIVISKTVYQHVSEALTSLLHVEAEKEYGKTVKAIFKQWAQG